MRVRIAFATVATVVGLLAPIGPLAATSARTTAPKPEPALTWHSAGDSYSSGEGVFGNVGACAQAKDAYGPRAKASVDATDWAIGRSAFTACTGHLVEDFRSRRPGSSKDDLADWAGAQGLPDGRADVLALSFGGNDIGFADVILDCLPTSDWVVGGIIGGCDDSEADLNARVDALLDPKKACTGGRLKGGFGQQGRRDRSFDWSCDLLLDDRGTPNAADDLRGSIVDFYRLLVDDHLTDRGHLYVVGYPAVFAPIGEWRSWNAFGCAGVRWGDAEKLTRVAQHFDDKLREASERADGGSGRISYISRYDQFRDGGHELCGRGEDWINGLTKTRGPGLQWARWQSSFHPNAAGHADTADELANLVLQRNWNAPRPITTHELANFTLPAEVCDYLDLPGTSHRLHDGTFEAPNDLTIDATTSAVGDLDGDGAADGVLGIGCMNGIADHITDVYVVLARDRKVRPVELVRAQPELEAFDPRAESLNDVTALRVEGGELRVDMTFTFLNDPSCCPTSTAVGTYRVQAKQISRTALDVHDDRWRTDQLARAISAGDRDRIAELVVDEWAESFDPYIDEDATFTAGDCVLPDILSEFRYCHLEQEGTDLVIDVEWDGPSTERRAIPLFGD